MRYTFALDGEQLPGGNSLGAVRIGDTVRRAAQPWTLLGPRSGHE